MAGSSYVVRGEGFLDGDAAAAPITVTLYDMGSDGETRTLKSTEFFRITDIFVHLEAGGDFSVYVGSDAAGKRILIGNVAANGGVSRRYKTPWMCKRGGVPTLVGASSGRNTLMVEGFITEG